MAANNSKSARTKPNFDPVIELWYADPYERSDPDQLAHVQQRRVNLENALTNQGFGHARIMPIVNWLMRCNGRYRDFDDRKGREKGGVSRKRQRIEEDDKSETALGDETIFSTDDDGRPTARKRPRLDKASDETSIESGITSIDIDGDEPRQPLVSETLFNGYNSDGLDDMSEDVLPSTEQLLKILGTDIKTPNDSEFTLTTEQNNNSPHRGSARDGSLADSTIDDGKFRQEKSLMRAIESRLRFWDIIYGAPPNSQLPAVSTLPKSVTSIPGDFPDELTATSSNYSHHNNERSDANTNFQETGRESEFTWFHSQTPRLIRPLRTQNLQPSSIATVNGMSCDVEDPTFGLYVVPEVEQMAIKEKLAWEEENRIKLRHQQIKQQAQDAVRRCRQIETEFERELGVWSVEISGNSSQRVCGWNTESDWSVGSFSNGYREVWKELETIKQPAYAVDEVQLQLEEQATAADITTVTEKTLTENIDKRYRDDTTQASHDIGNDMLPTVDVPSKTNKLCTIAQQGDCFQKSQSTRSSTEMIDETSSAVSVSPKSSKSSSLVAASASSVSVRAPASPSSTTSSRKPTAKPRKKYTPKQRVKT